MSDSPKYVKDCPVMMPQETYNAYSAIKADFDKARSAPGFEAGFGNFRSGYSSPMFNGHNQSTTLSTLNKK